MIHLRKIAFVLAVSLGLTSLAFADEVISAGQPDAQQIQSYAQDGVKTIIDLRTDGEDRGMESESKVVEDAGMRYVSLPTSRGDITFEQAEALDNLLEANPGPVVVHCGSGNRVGALMALRASMKGASDDEALKVGRKYGLTSLAKRVEGVLAENE